MRRCPLVAQIGHWHVYSITLSTISYAGGLIDETKHCASGGLGIGWYANSRAVQTVNVQSLMGDGYTVAGVVSAPAGGRGRFPAERQGAFFVLSPRIPIPHPDTQYCKPVK